MKTEQEERAYVEKLADELEGFRSQLKRNRLKMFADLLLRERAAAREEARAVNEYLASEKHQAEVNEAGAVDRMEEAERRLSEMAKLAKHHHLCEMPGNCYLCRHNDKVEALLRGE